LKFDAGSIANGYRPLLLHKNKESVKGNPPQCHIKKNSKFTLDLRVNEHYLAQRPPISYEDLLKLSFLLGGLGKRSRKGRGNVAVLSMQKEDEEAQSLLHKSKEELLNWILHQLNALNGDGKFFRQGNKIVLKEDKDLRAIAKQRPLLYQISVGDCLTDVIDFLATIDEVCHKESKNMSVMGYGGSGGHFASALIIGVVRIDRDLYPIYTQVSEVHTMSHKKSSQHGSGSFSDKKGDAVEKWSGEFECKAFMETLRKEMNPK